MKKYTNNILIYITILAGLFSVANVQAAKITVNGVSTPLSTTQSKGLQRSEVFAFYAYTFGQDIPESYKYIQLKYSDLFNTDENYNNLQKLVYLDLIDNTNKSVHLNKTMNAHMFYILSADILGTTTQKLIPENLELLQSRDTQRKDLIYINKVIEQANKASIGKPGTTNESKNIEYKKAIFTDVYSTLLNKHYNKEDLDENEILDKAIQGITDGVEDRHTVYFPPVESESFQQSLNGEYEGIGSYVDAKKPGVIEITAPLRGSPAERAGVKAGDIITHVDGVVVTEKNSLREVISWIKGPAGTDVVLTISRKTQTLDITVTREKIVIQDVEFSKIGSKIGYIEMKSFGEKSAKQFQSAIEEIKKDTRIKNIIIDLRNNGGGYLGQSQEILSHFIKIGEPVTIVKRLENDEVLGSRGYKTIDLNQYRVVILQNAGTASASEIFIGTLKDYFPEVTTIGEKSYGKGSVQTTKQYKDGSLLKYTIAKWYTGKSETGIDGIGITPDIELALDDERFLKDGYDNQLEAAKRLR